MAMLGEGEKELFTAHHVRIMKTALAIAILRVKPGDVGAKEFTERLSLLFGQLQKNWKERAEKLEQELLRARQELVQYQVQVENFSGQTDSLGDLLSSGYSSSFPSSISQQPMKTSNANPLGISSQNSHTNGECEQQKKGVDEDRGDEGCSHSSSRNILPERIRANIKFLSSVSSLLSTWHKFSAVTSSDLRATVRDTLLESIRGLSEALKSTHLSKFPLPCSSFDDAIKKTAEMIQLPSMGLFLSELLSSCMELLDAIVTRLANHDNREEERCCLQEAVVLLCDRSELFQHCTQLLIAAVLKCAQMLTTAIQDCNCLDPDLIDGAASVFQVLESLFLKYDVTTIPHNVRQRLVKDLEESLLELIQPFPLFAYSSWKTIAYLSTD